MFTSILIANRGEIAVRVMRTCRAMGIATVAVYSDADRDSLHVRQADQAIWIGPAPAAASYLHVERILSAARRSGAQAIHPGYGFLSERAHFAAACEAAGIAFIGPPASAMRLMGDKISAKRLAIQVGVPTVPGYQSEPGVPQQAEVLYREAQRIGCPLLIKAAAGGGGKGMREVHDLGQFAASLAAAQREALAAFGDGTLFLERLIERPRHIEIQVLADKYGNCVHVFERECSIQRRHQKIVEESPSTVLTPELREAMGSAAVRLAQAAGYVNAGTVEFLLGEDLQYYFLEMNTRLQVEHPVTEMITGLDVVQMQIEIAAGATLPFQQADLLQNGHAIEVRLCAEDSISFLPASGQIMSFIPPEATLARVDSGSMAGDTIGIYYDSLLAKLIVHGEDRAAAIAKLQQALQTTALLGVTSNLPLLHTIAQHPAFAAGDTTTDFLTRYQIAPASFESPAPQVLAGAAVLTQQRENATLSSDPWAAGAWRHSGSGAVRRFLYGNTEYALTLVRTSRGYTAMVGANEFDITIISCTAAMLVLQIDQQSAYLPYCWQEGNLWLSWQGWQISLAPAIGLVVQTAQADRNIQAQLEAPMPGTIIRVLVTEGSAVVAKQPIVVIEAMKMEYVVGAPHAGIVECLHVVVGSMVSRGMVLAEVSVEADER